MSRKIKAILIIFACVCATGAGAWIILSENKFPDTLAENTIPTMYLPINNFTYVDMIGGYGNVQPGNFHPGIDFCINDTTPIVAPCNAYISYIQGNWFNEVGNVYQTNIHLRLNAQWRIELLWESDAATEINGTYQLGNITVNLGDYVTTNQTLGKLFYHGPQARLHLGVKSYEKWECPYRFFNCTARVLYEEQFDRVGDKMYCSCCYCCD
jgi:hypothetical protein